MALIKPVKGVMPKWGKNCFLAENATVIGDVVMGDECSVWFLAVVRGDVNSIRLGDRVNIQDGAIIHCTFEESVCIVGDDVTVGHRAILHGCEVMSETLIGMGAIVMDHAVVESHVIVAAGAVVLEHQRLESGGIYAGIPAKKVKSIDPELIKGKLLETARRYVEYTGWMY